MTSKILTVLFIPPVEFPPVALPPVAAPPVASIPPVAPPVPVSGAPAVNQEAEKAPGARAPENVTRRRHGLRTATACRTKAMGYNWGMAVMAMAWACVAGLLVLGCAPEASEPPRAPQDAEPIQQAASEPVVQKPVRTEERVRAMSEREEARQHRSAERASANQRHVFDAALCDSGADPSEECARQQAEQGAK